jgi:hypothetical protein
MRKLVLVLICALALPAMAQPSNLRLPDESAGIDGIVHTLISAFDQMDIVALGEAHGRRADSDLRIALVRHPDFAKKVRSIVVEFGSTAEQSTLDRYIGGENVSRAQLERVWKTTSNGVWDSPIYADFSWPFATSTRSCPPMREFACSGATPDQQTSATAKPPP